jgi:hypothetical protein
VPDAPALSHRAESPLMPEPTEAASWSPTRFRQPDDVFLLRVTLIDVAPPIWRRVLVPQDISLPSLHRVLQAAMGWTDSHLHQFKAGEVHFAEPSDEDYEPVPIDYRRIALNQLIRHKGSTCIYEYDFGDGWDHLIEVEDELSADAVIGTLPRCTGGERACPPEDCGGPSGYAEFLAVLSDPENEEHDHYVEWSGGDFDPEAFDLQRVNRTLARIASGVRPRTGRQR